ncbi:RNB domain-containing ribonuclease [Georgenia sp. Z1491]|uniref:RNB domain-containing ribonuclease n=1 Tax=Georgenia sp. Z1491 TaxID=3416707 RepID=UPI003CF04AF3
MPTRHLRINTAAPDELKAALDALAAELELPTAFSPEVLAEAEAAAEGAALPAKDLTDLDLVTIDPPGARDLDQAVLIERDGDGHRIRYAIASVGSFVTPGGALDEEVRRRAMTVYGPTGSVPLHPEVLSAGAASLLAGQVAPACVWDVRIDSTGEVRSSAVERALVRSRAQLTYDQVQDALDGRAQLAEGVPADLPRLLAEVGRARQAQEVARGAVSLDLPEQVVELGDGGRYVLDSRTVLEVEGYNAQISLLTGIVAAEMMLGAGVGILRTLPPAREKDVAKLRRTAHALGVPWPDGMSYPDLVRSVKASTPEGAAFLNEATALFRGAGYLALPVSPGEGGDDGEGGDVVSTQHAAIASDYAHVTAPLRRLVDRYGLEACLAIAADTEVPGWVREALPELPSAMGARGRRASAYERGAVDAMEALVLRGREGEELRGVVVDVDEKKPQRGEVQVAEPAVHAVVEGEGLELGAEVTVRVAEVDVQARKVRVEVV